MLSPDTVIPTLSGPMLAQDLLNSDPVYVFTWDGERVTVGEIEVEEGKLAVPYRIKLDDESSFCVGAETMVLLRDGSPRYPEQLSPGDSLLPLYAKIDRYGYPVYQEPGDWHKDALAPSDKNRWRRVSRMVAEWKLGRRCEPGDVVSYVSKNKMNCSPENLEVSRKKRKQTEKKSSFAEHLFEAQRFIDWYNHQVDRTFLDTSRNLLSIRGLRTANLSVGGIFVSVDAG